MQSRTKGPSQTIRRRAAVGSQCLIGLIVDAIPDLFSTVLNVTGDLAAAAIVARKGA